MDIERIKHGFRLRSGRLKRSKKFLKESTESPGRGLVEDIDRPASNPATLLPDEDVEYERLESGLIVMRRKQNAASPPSSPRRAPPPAHVLRTVSDVSSFNNKPLPIPTRPAYKASKSKGNRNVNGKSRPSAESQDGQENRRSSSSEQDFLLRAPLPNKTLSTIDGLLEQLFSQEYLQFVIHDPILFARFTGFLNRYRPHLAPLLIQYLETRKAISAVEYANAVAANMSALPRDRDSIARVAASVDPGFEQRCRTASEMLENDALPALVTYDLVKIVTDVMVKEITGAHQTPVMRDLVQGLTEVFCLTDPSLEDNHIIYASDEFYRMTGYGRDFVIGRNCRFLQGPKTNSSSLNRMRQALDEGREVSETLLNYRRDGTPFINLLMIAPLLDDQGNVRYFIGAQVDVTGLVDDGRGLDGFDKFLQQTALRDEEDEAEKLVKKPANGKSRALEKLRELSEMFDLEESAIVQSHSRSNSMTRDEESSVASFGTQKRPGKSVRRKLIDSTMDDDEEETREQRASWTLALSGRSGKLPGVYEKFFLLRPTNSLRIVFVSPALQKFGNLLQTPFLTYVSASETTLTGLKDSFSSGTPVTAKIAWHQNGRARTNHGSHQATSAGDVVVDLAKDGIPQKPQTCWIAATPLLGSDDKIGVWMVIMVDKNSLRNSRPPQRPMPPENQSPVRSHNGRSQVNGMGRHHSAATSTQTEAYENELVRRSVPAPVARAERVIINGSPQVSEFPATTNGATITMDDDRYGRSRSESSEAMENSGTGMGAVDREGRDRSINQGRRARRNINVN